MEYGENSEEKRFVYEAMSAYKSQFFTAVALHRETFAAVHCAGKLSSHTVLEYPSETHQHDGDIWTEMRLVAVPNGVAASHRQLPRHEACRYPHKVSTWSVPQAIPRTVTLFEWWLNIVMAEVADFEPLDGKTMKEAFEIISPRPTSPYKW